MGIFDLPSPLLGWLDSQVAAVLPAWLRLVLWGGLSALFSMLVYRQISAQERISRGKRELKRAQQRLNAFEGELNQAWPLMHDMLRTALRQVARVSWPAVLASLPLLFLLNWMSTAYGYTYPPTDARLQIQTTPVQFRAEWISQDSIRAGGRSYPHIVIYDLTNRKMLETQMQAPVPVIHKRQWWNMLIGNPAGYLPFDAPIDRIQAQLPRQQHLSFGPNWMRTWELMFFASLLAVSAGLKLKLKIA